MKPALALLLAVLLVDIALWAVDARQRDEAVVAASWGCRR